MTASRTASRRPSPTRPSWADICRAHAAPSAGSVPNASASATCMRATVAPSRRESAAKSARATRGSRPSSSSPAIDAAASDEPEPSDRSKVLSTPRSVAPSAHTSSGTAASAKPTLPSARVTSTSGLAPSCSWRNTLRMNRSSNTTDVLDCSPFCSSADANFRSGKSVAPTSSAVSGCASAS